METKKISIEKLVIIAGASEAVTLIAYFMLMRYLNMADIIELRSLNLFIQLAFILIVLKYYHYKTKVHIHYLNGLSLGFFTSAVGVVLFSIFVYLYFLKSDPVLLQLLKSNSSLMGDYLTPLSAAVTVVIEGTISALLLSYIVMQYFKDDPKNAKNDNKVNTDQKF
jgi:hypothetical protein